MQRLSILFLICTVTFFGCGPREDAQLYIYCNETFWYVMQEEALYFNQSHGFQIILIPIGADRTTDTTESAVEIGTERRPLAQWRSRIREHAGTKTTDPHTQIHPDIEERIKRISTEHFGDMFLSDSPKHLDTIRKSALSTNEYAVCYLTLTMLVPTGNPYQFHSVKDVLNTNRTLGIVDPSRDGLGESSWKMLERAVPTVPMELVQLYERQYDLLEALEQGTIDAAIVWNTASQFNFLLVKYSDEYNAADEKLMREAERKKNDEQLQFILREMCRDLVETRSFAEEIPLTENPDERYIISVRLVALSSAFNFGFCERFADFMRSKQGKEVLQRFGFVAE